MGSRLQWRAATHDPESAASTPARRTSHARRTRRPFFAARRIQCRRDFRAKLKQQAEAEHNRELVQEEAPDWRLTFNPDTLLEAYLRWERSDFTYLPSPEEIEQTPKRFREEVEMVGQLLKFQRDAYADD